MVEFQDEAATRRQSGGMRRQRSLKVRFVGQGVDVDDQVRRLVGRAGGQSRFDEPAQPRTSVVAVQFDNGVSGGEILGLHHVDRRLLGVKL